MPLILIDKITLRAMRQQTKQSSKTAKERSHTTTDNEIDHTVDLQTTYQDAWNMLDAHVIRAHESHHRERQRLVANFTHMKIFTVQHKCDKVRQCFIEVATKRKDVRA